jgi:hypothetical protein
MLYAIPDILLKVSLNTNKTGKHVIPDTLFIGINATVNNISAMMYNMAQFYWCLTTLSTMC